MPLRLGVAGRWAVRVGIASGAVGAGHLDRSCPPELVDRVVAEAEGGEERRRLLLSARLKVYCVLGLRLLPRADYLESGWTVMHDLFRAVARMVAGAECSSHAVFGRGDRRLEGLRADRVRPTGTACRPDRRADWLTPAH